MAEVTVNPRNKNPEELTNQGIRAYLDGDFSSAVEAFSIASELLVAQHGDKHDDLGDVYRFYGKSLLELYREESEPLGDAVTKKLDDEDDEEESSEEEVNGQPPNGEVKEAKEEQGESTEDQEGEPSDLQVAWEVLELAKLIFENRGEGGKEELADTLISLGEVSLESENFESAVTDIKHGLELLKSLSVRDDRRLAETHYKLGMALSTNSQMDEAVENFNKSIELLQKRIKALEEGEKSEDSAEEIEQMKGLLPELEEKIADMKNFKEEALKTLTASVEEKPQTSTLKNDVSAPAKANDISHLVKRKRNLEDVVADAEACPAKKPSL